MVLVQNDAYTAAIIEVDDDAKWESKSMIISSFCMKDDILRPSSKDSVQLTTVFVTYKVLLLSQFAKLYRWVHILQDKPQVNIGDLDVQDILHAKAIAISEFKEASVGMLASICARLVTVSPVKIGKKKISKL